MQNKLSTRQAHSNPKRIISFCGKKQSGKDSSANFVGATLLYQYSCIDQYQLTRTGIILDGIERNINEIAPKFLKIYHWADTLKEACSALFNIDIRLMYGTDKDKDTLTDLKWEDMPGIITNKLLYSDLKKHIDRKSKLLGASHTDNNFDLIFHEPGPMSIREILQFFGTDICRKMYDACWTESLEKKIIRDNPIVVLIADTRFDNEAEVVKSWGGLCIKLERDKFSNKHKSENGFKTFQNWDLIIDNNHTDEIPQFCELLCKTLGPLGIFKEII